MKYYRDILLFPKFNNVDIIERIRKECDELYGIIQPHITIGQKFNSDEEQLRKIENMSEEFECYIDTVVIEKIGANEESIILDKIILDNTQD